MSRRRLAPVLVALPFLLAPAAFADPLGRDTTQEAIEPDPGSGYRGLQTTEGEDYAVRRGPGAKARPARARQRRSLLFFAQITDPQIVDEMSPARVDFADPGGGELKSSWRPHEALGTQTFDSVVRNVNANRKSRVRQRGGKRAKLELAITTGDLADNQQLNETRWFQQVLVGGRVDPF